MASPFCRASAANRCCFESACLRKVLVLRLQPLTSMAYLQPQVWQPRDPSGQFPTWPVPGVLARAALFALVLPKSAEQTLEGHV